MDATKHSHREDDGKRPRTSTPGSGAGAIPAHFGFPKHHFAQADATFWGGAHCASLNPSSHCSHWRQWNQKINSHTPCTCSRRYSQWNNPRSSGQPASRQSTRRCSCALMGAPNSTSTQRPRTLPLQHPSIPWNSRSFQPHPTCRPQLAFQHAPEQLPSSNPAHPLQRWRGARQSPYQPAKS